MCFVFAFFPSFLCSLRSASFNALDLLFTFNTRHLFVAQVPSLPRFVEPLNNVTVVAGRDVHLGCVVDNIQKYTVIFEKKKKKRNGAGLNEIP